MDILQKLRSLEDRYSIERQIGSGGMATVYLARDVKHGREVAIKVLRADLSAVIGTERFLAEIRIAASLDHPHILTLIDSGSADGLLYYVLPYVRGESLRAKLEREKQLGVQDAISITTQVASALDYAHAQGVVHRDIKPENILLHEGEAVLADFGIALAVEQAGGDRLTETGQSLGTPKYMSPEQAMGDRSLDRRSDVYSLGAVFYEMIAGEPPVTGPSAQAIIAKLLTQKPVKLRVMRETIPLAMEQATEKALGKTPADRFGSAGEFARALAPAPEPERSFRGSRVTRTVVGVAAVAVIATSLWLARAQSNRSANAAATLRDGTVSAAPVRLAVLPFENLGRPEDAYFVDGVADELRGKLAGLPGVEVIARASSNEYRTTSKRPKQIARELGVRYLLVGTVRWDKRAAKRVAASGPDTLDRVRVLPELVEIAPGDGGAPLTKWQQPFDATIAGVFDVQADIAQQVVEALKISLGIGERSQLAARPTDNLAAYDAFLQGEETSNHLSAVDPQTLRRASRFYERAVAADSTFAKAWARVAEAQTELYFLTAAAQQDTARIRVAAERAVTLAPERPDGNRALGNYYLLAEHNPRRAAAEFALARRKAPNDAELLIAASTAEVSLGSWREAILHQRRAALIDPRSASAVSWLGGSLLSVRDYSNAREALDRALTLAPAELGIIEKRTMVELANGNLSGARAVIRSAPKEVATSGLVAFIANYNDLGWALDDAHQRLLLGLSPAAFDDDRSAWALCLAQAHAFRGDIERARVFADSAHQEFERLVRASPNDPALRALHGVSLAYLGRRADAVREGQRAKALLPISKDAQFGPYMQHQLARIYIIVGEPEKALDQLEPLLKMPYFLSPGWLRIDPNFAPLRGNPRFDRLVGGG